MPNVETHRYRVYFRYDNFSYVLPITVDTYQGSQQPTPDIMLEAIKRFTHLKDITYETCVDITEFSTLG